MATKSKKQKWENLKEEDYYYYSRCRFWTVLEFVRLVFNDARWEFDTKDPHIKYIEEIKKANHGWRISDFDLEDIRERWPYQWFAESRRNKAYSSKEVIVKNPFKYYPGGFDLELNRKVYSASAYFWAFNEGKEKTAYSPRDQFLSMQGEMSPKEFYVDLRASHHWTIAQVIRIIFGERFAGISEWEKDPRITRFCKLAETAYHGGFLGEAKKVEPAEFFYWKFDRLKIFDWLEARDINDWLICENLDILHWMDVLFEEIENQVKLDSGWEYKFNQKKRKYILEKPLGLTNDVKPRQNLTVLNGNEGGRPKADHDRKIEEKIRELLSTGVKQEQIPYHPDLLKLLPNKPSKISQNVSGKNYTALAGISTDTLKRIVDKILSSE